MLRRTSNYCDGLILIFNFEAMINSKDLTDDNGAEFPTVVWKCTYISTNKQEN